PGPGHRPRRDDRFRPARSGLPLLRAARGAAQANGRVRSCGRTAARRGPADRPAGDARSPGLVTEPLADASAEAVVRALEAHTREQTVAWSGLRGTHVEDRPDMLLVLSGRPVAWTNGVHFARFDPADADRKIAETTKVFREANVPALWRVTDTSRPADLSMR